MKRTGECHIYTAQLALLKLNFKLILNHSLAEIIKITKVY